MCGISGIISLNKKPIEKATLKSMTEIISHRGPDGEGHWQNSEATIALGHRRLSIIDLSHSANQPMHYMDRYTIVFNGEIYNYIEIKETLIKQGYSFTTVSDTEVLLALYHRDKEECLQLLDGMFSFVMYDAKENCLFCARDRFGEKPFFYSYIPNEHFYFGSEMKCLWAGGIEKKINNRMLFNYLSFDYIDNPSDLSETFYDNCTRLPHAHFIKINLNSNDFSLKKYYDINLNNLNSTITLKQASNNLLEIFNTSVQRRLRSDVPVGSSLSGGLDSSLVVCTIDDILKNSSQIQKTFSAVFPGFAKDERKYIDIITSKTKVQPFYVTPTNDELINDFEKLCWHQEEPFSSSSIYVQYKVMQLAKQNNITVLLDGQGADEILAGYHHYFPPYFNELKKSKNYQNQYQKYVQLHSTNTINGITKKTLGGKIRDISPKLVKPFKKLKNDLTQLKNPIFNPDFYNENKKYIFENSGNYFQTLNESLYSSTIASGRLQELLRYADRNSMAHSREVRLPFLSHELVDFLFTLPAEMKINNGWTKWIMRETFDTLPNEIAWRKDKIGYEPPQNSWLESIKVKEKVIENIEKLKKNNFVNKKFNHTKGLNWKFIVAGELI